METLRDIQVDLSCVAVDDQQLVKDVCAVMATVRKDVQVASFSVTVSNGGYLIASSFPAGLCVDVSKAELDTIVDINPFRVVSVSVCRDYRDGHVDAQLSLNVRVCSMDHPVTLTETSLVRIVKKRKWFGSIL